MKALLTVAVLSAVALAHTAWGQGTEPARPAQPPGPRFGPSPEQQAKTQADHRHLLDLLKISALRPGASGNPSAPNAANADESRVGTYTLPDPSPLQGRR
jgi:hypothetical protein